MKLGVTLSRPVLVATLLLVAVPIPAEDEAKKKPWGVSSGVGPPTAAGGRPLGAVGWPQPSAIEGERNLPCLCFANLPRNNRVLAFWQSTFSWRPVDYWYVLLGHSFTEIPIFKLG
jgi:hypothetical protein